MASEVSRETTREQAAKPRWVEDAVAYLFACSSCANPGNSLAPGLPWNCHMHNLRDVLLYFSRKNKQKKKKTRKRGLGIS